MFASLSRLSTRFLIGNLLTLAWGKKWFIGGYIWKKNVTSIQLQYLCSTVGVKSTAYLHFPEAIGTRNIYIWGIMVGFIYKFWICLFLSSSSILEWLFYVSVFWRPSETLIFVAFQDHFEISLLLFYFEAQRNDS